MWFWGASLAGTAIAYLKGKTDGLSGVHRPNPSATGLAGVNWLVLGLYVVGLWGALTLFRPFLKKIV